MATGERIYGPYPHRRGFKVVVVDGTGKRTTQTFPSEGEAQDAADAARAELAGRQVSEAIEAYLAAGRARELRESSLASTGTRLRVLFGVDVAKGHTGGLLAAITPRRAARLVDAMGAATVTGSARWPRHQPRSVAYRRGALAEAGTFARWCVKRGWLPADPFAGLKVEGRVRRGKRQLTIEQARVFGAKCLELVGAGDETALAALLALVEGCRASEITDREVKDVDDGGGILWIPLAKTDAGRRRLEVPPYLQAPLLKLCRDAFGRRRPPTARVFGAERVKEVDRHWLGYHVHRLCGLAGVPEVCPQSLRGLHATLATLAGRTSHDVAAALGHTSPTVTERHYTDDDALATSAGRRVFGVLQGGKS
jgi:integrase